MNNVIGRTIIKHKLDSEHYYTIKNHVLPAMKYRIPLFEQKGEDSITRGAQAMLLFHADKESESHTEDLYIDVAYGLLAAHALGLGASAINLVPPAIERVKELRKIFRIPNVNEVLGCIILGYPKYRFKRGIKRELKSITWI